MKKIILDVREKDWEIIERILSNYPYLFYAFGSRVKNKAKKFSDLDLCYKEAIPDAVVAKIEEEFEESDLPFKVEFINWNQCSTEFQKMIEKDLVVLIRPNPAI